MQTIKNIFKISNIGTMIFCVLNLGLILSILTNGFTTNEVIPYVVIIYFITILISLSPLGEFLFAFMIGARKMLRKDMKLKMIPLLQIAYDKSKEKCPQMVNSINLKLINDPYPNAYAIGRKTICVTTGLFQLSDDAIIGIFAHELGHIANSHSTIQLIIGGANIFITVGLFILKVVAWIIRIIVTFFAIKSRSWLETILLFIASLFSTGLLALWTKFCLLFLRTSMRANEYVADKFAYDIGFGKQLAMALSILQNYEVPKKNIFGLLYSTHPDINNRIYRLQLLGVDYNAYL